MPMRSGQKLLQHNEACLQNPGLGVCCQRICFLTSPVALVDVYLQYVAPEKLFAESISALMLVASPIFFDNSPEKLFFGSAKIDELVDRKRLDGIADVEENYFGEISQPFARNSAL